MRPLKPFRPSARPLAELVDAALAPAARKRGFAAADLFAAWDDVAGELFAATTAPERIVWSRRLLDGGDEAGDPGTLVIRCAGPGAVLVQHRAEILLDRVNAFLGWRAVDRLKILQAPLPAASRPPRKPPPVLAPGDEAALQEKLGGIADPGLQAALARLGRAVLHTKS